MSKHTTQILRAGHSEVCNQGLFSLALPDFQSLPDSISLPSRHLIAFLAANSAGVDSKTLTEFSRQLLRAGCVYFCAWGTDCERAHDIFDGECLTIEPVIMTTWHADESLDEALWFFVFSAFPAEAYEVICRSGLAISIGKPEWDQHVRMRLRDIDSLGRCGDGN